MRAKLICVITTAESRDKNDLVSKINLSPLVASFAGSSKAVALLLFICMCLLLLPLFVGV